MALATYSDLQTSLANWMDRTELATVIPDFITLFETTANVELPIRTRYNLTSTTLTATTNNPLMALPSDFLEAVALIETTNGLYKQVSALPVSSLYTSFPQPNSGQPGGFAIEGTNILFAPVPDSARTYKLHYYQKITALTTLAPTNWLLTNFPNLYLFGSLTAAEAYLGNDPRLQTWGNLYDNFLQKLTGSVERSKYGGTPLTVKFDAVI